MGLFFFVPVLLVMLRPWSTKLTDFFGVVSWLLHTPIEAAGDERAVAWDHPRVATDREICTGRCVFRVLTVARASFLGMMYV